MLYFVLYFIRHSGTVPHEVSYTKYSTYCFSPRFSVFISIMSQRLYPLYYILFGLTVIMFQFTLKHFTSKLLYLMFSNDEVLYVNALVNRQNWDSCYGFVCEHKWDKVVQNCVFKSSDHRKPWSSFKFSMSDFDLSLELVHFQNTFGFVLNHLRYTDQSLLLASSKENKTVATGAISSQVNGIS